MSDLWIRVAQKQLFQKQKDLSWYYWQYAPDNWVKM